MSESKTPRTDDATLTEPYLVRELAFEVVTTDFARQLEIELDELKLDRDMDAEVTQIAESDIQRLETELAASKSREALMAESLGLLLRNYGDMEGPEGWDEDCRTFKSVLEAWRAAKCPCSPELNGICPACEDRMEGAQ